MQENSEHLQSVCFLKLIIFHPYAYQVSTNHGFDPDSTMASEPTLSTLAQLAAEAASAQQAEDPSSSSSPSSSKTKEQMRRHYLRALHKVIDESDIIILVLDARDPEGCRSRLVEEEVRRREMEGKKLVFVLNKIGVFCIIAYSRTK
jgi:nuclear GTP-binding protein